MALKKAACFFRQETGQLTGVENISDKKAQEYLSASEEYEQNALDGLDERVEAKINGTGRES